MFSVIAVALQDVRGRRARSLLGAAAEAALLTVGTEDVDPKSLRKMGIGWARWLRFCAEEQCSSIPADPYDVALFYTILMLWCERKGYAMGPLLVAADAIAYAHNHRGLANPARAAMAGAVLEAAKRRLGRPRVKSRPITDDILAKLSDRFAKEADIGWFTIYVIILIGFAGMFRYDDMTHIDLGVSEIFIDHARLFVATRKTDKIYEGKWVAIAAVGGRGCPVRALKRWQRLSGISSGSFCLQVYRSRVDSRQERVCRLLPHKSLTYNRFRENMQVAFVMAGVPVDQAREFGTRCLRMGAATKAITLGVDAHLVMEHGGWKTPAVMLGYVVSSLQRQLSVSRALFKI